MFYAVPASKAATVACNYASTYRRSKESMYRLPLINMCNRETNRLPIAKIVKILGCEVTPPIELRKSASEIPPSTKFFVYHYTQDELGGAPSLGKNKFILVEADGLKEKVLDEGEASGYTVHSGLGFLSLSVTGKKLGRFAFYCSSSPKIERETYECQNKRFVKILVEDHARGVY